MKFQHGALLLLVSVAHGADIRGGRTPRLYERGLKSSKKSSKSSSSKSLKYHPVPVPSPPSETSGSTKVSKKTTGHSEMTSPSKVSKKTGSSKTTGQSKTTGSSKTTGHSKMTGPSKTTGHSKTTGSSKVSKTTSGSSKTSNSQPSHPDVCRDKDYTTLKKYTVRQTGADRAAISGVVDDYKSKLNGNVQVNWDGPAVPTLPNSTLSGDFFKATRGLEMTCDDCEFLVSGKSGSGDDKFNSTNPEASKGFVTYSDPSLLATSGNTEFDADFVTMGENNTDATVAGFGIVFVDVDKFHTTGVTYYDCDGCVLATEYADVYDSGLSFLGVMFDDYIVDRVEINAGDATIDDTYETSSSSSSDSDSDSDSDSGKSTSKSAGKGKGSGSGKSSKSSGHRLLHDDTGNSTHPGNSTDSVESDGTTKSTKGSTKSSKKGATGESGKSSKKGSGSGKGKGKGGSGKSSKKSSGKSSKKSSGRGDDIVVMDDFIYSRLLSKEKREVCVNAGGTVESGPCCDNIDDFPNTCATGVCGCESSESTIFFCTCPDGQCFDGDDCIAFSPID